MRNANNALVVDAPVGGTNYSITSTQQLLSVPYALYSREAGNGFSGDYNDLVNTPDIPVVPTNVSAFTNDAGYITMDSVPAIPTNVGAFNNDAGYITMDSVPRPFLWCQLRPRSCAVSVPHSALAGWRFRLAGAFARVAI